VNKRHDRSSDEEQKLRENRTTKSWLVSQRQFGAGAQFNAIPRYDFFQKSSPTCVDTCRRCCAWRCASTTTLAPIGLIPGTNIHRPADLLPGPLEHAHTMAGPGAAPRCFESCAGRCAANTCTPPMRGAAPRGQPSGNRRRAARGRTLPAPTHASDHTTHTAHMCRHMTPFNLARLLEGKSDLTIPAGVWHPPSFPP
jgi:hypothetical protein